MELDDQDKRIIAIIGDNEDVDIDESRSLYYQHLKTNLILPCQVTGIEDFRWEEYFVFGPGDQAKYMNLKKTQPSYTDKYELLGIDKELLSEWMFFGEEDIAARVKRISDGKEFILGLSELRAVDKKSDNYQILDDFSVWLVNNR